MSTRIKVGNSRHLHEIQDDSIIFVEITPAELGVMFATMDVEEQAAVLVAAAAEGETWDGSAIIQWDRVGIHLAETGERDALSMCKHLSGEG